MEGVLLKKGKKVIFKVFSREVFKNSWAVISQIEEALYRFLNWRRGPVNNVHKVLEPFVKRFCLKAFDKPFIGEGKLNERAQKEHFMD